MNSSENPRGAEPYAPPNEPVPAETFKHKRWSTQTLLVVSLYVLLASSAAYSVIDYESSTAFYGTSIAFAIFATMWAINDSRVREMTFHPILRMLHLLFCPISLVIYLVVTRGIRGLGIASLHSVGMLVVANLAYYGFFYAIYFSGYWDLYDPIYMEP